VRRVMGGVVLGAVGVVALQALLIIGYLAVGRQDPIVLNPDRHALEDEGVSMVMFCGKGGGGVLTKVPQRGFGSVDAGKDGARQLRPLVAPTSTERPSRPRLRSSPSLWTNVVEFFFHDVHRSNYPRRLRS
jgi:hypothetical protein